MKDEILYKLFKALERCSDTNQRVLAQELGMSLGSMNHCIKKMLDSGFLTTESSIGDHKKRCYIYHLTPAGLTERAAVTMRYLQSLIDAQHQMSLEIETLREEATRISAALQKGLASLCHETAPSKNLSISKLVNKSVVASIATNRLQPKPRKRA